MTKELTEQLRKSRTVDWNLKESARAGMRRMVKSLLHKYHYPPEGMADAMKTVLQQCEMWTDNVEDNQDYCIIYIFRIIEHLRIRNDNTYYPI